MAIECYKTECEFHASHNCTDIEDCEGPYCDQDECRHPEYHSVVLTCNCVTICEGGCSCAAFKDDSIDS